MSSGQRSAGRLVEVLTTLPGEEEARELARRLVEEGLAACVNFFPVRSVYRWKGRLEEEDEVQLACKTLQERACALERRILELHPYETPAVLRVPLLAANEGYALWVEESLAGSGTSRHGGTASED